MRFQRLPALPTRIPTPFQRASNPPSDAHANAFQPSCQRLAQHTPVTPKGVRPRSGGVTPQACEASADSGSAPHGGSPHAAGLQRAARCSPFTRDQSRRPTSVEILPATCPARSVTAPAQARRGRLRQPSSGLLPRPPRRQMISPLGGGPKLSSQRTEDRRHTNTRAPAGFRFSFPIIRHSQSACHPGGGHD